MNEGLPLAIHNQQPQSMSKIDRIIYLENYRVELYNFLNNPIIDIPEQKQHALISEIYRTMQEVQKIKNAINNADAQAQRIIRGKA